MKKLKKDVLETFGIFAVAAVIAGALTSCQPPHAFPQSTTPGDANWVDLGHGVHKIIDENNNVACYVNVQQRTGPDAISCVAITIQKAQ